MIVETLTTIAGAGAIGAGLRWLWQQAGQAARDERIAIAALAAQMEKDKAIAITALAMQPRSITYAPHISISQGAAAGIVKGGTLESAPPPLPGIVDFASLGFNPSPQRLLLALGEGGEQITVPPRDLMHVALLGSTGGGKSNTIRLLASQLLAIGSDVSILDPHFAMLDAETGENWQMIAQRATIAISPGEIDSQLRFAIDSLDERLAIRREGGHLGRPITFFIDELPVITANIKGAMDKVTRLLREGRKVGVYFIGASQDMLTKTLGAGGALRDNFRTCYYSGGDTHSASILLDIPRRELTATWEGKLGKGIAMLRYSGGAGLVRVPLVSNASLSMLLGTSTNDTADTRAVNNGTPMGVPGVPVRVSVPGVSEVSGGVSGVTVPEIPTGDDTDALIENLVASGMGANRIYDVVGGNRGKVLARVRELRGK